MMTTEYLDDAHTAMLMAALWSSTDDDGEPLDGNYGTDDFTADADRRLSAELRGFLREAGDLLAGLHPREVGHDFWLTRNHHGAGFLDRGLGERGDLLTALADRYGEVDLYVTDGGEVAV